MTTQHPPTVSQDKPSLMKSETGSWLVQWPDRGLSIFRSWQDGMDAINARIRRWYAENTDPTGVK